MGSIDDFSQLCRLCLVKDQVNIPIFDETSDIGQTFLKINSCLPVKVSRDDNLPKKICDGCSYKLDMLYIFRNTSVDSEKQLISWLNQAGLSTISQTAMKDPLANTKSEIMVKQETFDATDSRIDGDHGDIGVDPQSYLMQQQQLAYQQDFDFGEPSGSNTELTDEPAPKRAKRAAALKKAPIDETDDVEDDLDAAMQITKAEEEDSEDIDQPDYVEPSTSADDQPGPSGVGKASVEAPFTVSQCADGTFPCDQCSKRFPNREKLRKHRRRHEEKTFKCSQCDRCCIYKSELLVHVNNVHNTHERRFKCEICNLVFKHKHNLVIHRMKHGNAYPFKCTTCGAGFPSQKAYETHIKVKHEGFSFICQDCGRVLKTQQGLVQHQKKNHDPNHIAEVFTCPICSVVLRSKNSLKRHMEIHKEEESRWVVCDLCGKSVKSLKAHKRVHAGEKNCVCEICGKKFGTMYTLITHRRTHTKEKPFQCPMCDKRFTQNSVLTIHLRYHTGERPYECEICSKKFISRTALNNHKCTN